MWTLRSGVVADCAPRAVALYFLTSGAKIELPKSAQALVESLAAGTADLTASEREILAEPLRLGWVVENDSVDDPLLRAGLDRLDRQFAWTGSTALPGYATALELNGRRRRLLRSLGQYPALPETVARRAALVGAAPQRVLVMGDDDFLSPVLARLGHEVVVCDVDPYLVAFLTREAERLGVPLKTVRWDFRQPVPAELRGQFAAVFTDPMSGPTCLPLFIDRALECLAPRGRLFVAVANAASRVFDVHRRDTALRTVDRHRDFNHYFTAQLTLAPYVSDLYVLERSADAHPLLAADVPFVGTGLYDEEHYGVRPSSRFVIRDIDRRFTELVHLQAAVVETCARVDVQIDEQLYHWDPSYRAYVALLGGGTLVAIYLHLDVGRCELLVTPPDQEKERVLQAVLLALYGGDEPVVQISRLRALWATNLT